MTMNRGRKAVMGLALNSHKLRQLALMATLLFPGAVLATTATVHKTPTCGCCGAYVAYLESNGFDTEVVNHDRMEPVFQEEGIDLAFASCHTTQVGPYTVVGHVPVEVIAGLLEERPMIRGIALPGMPAGSPGMGGAKQEAFTIYRITGDANDAQVYTRY